MKLASLFIAMGICFVSSVFGHFCPHSIFGPIYHSASTSERAAGERIRKKYIGRKIRFTSLEGGKVTERIGTIEWIENPPRIQPTLEYSVRILFSDQQQHITLTEQQIENSVID